MQRHALVSALIVTGLIGLAGCYSPQLPSTASRDVVMSDDDRQVMRAVLDQALRPTRDRMIQLGRGAAAAPTSLSAPPFLVFDSTIACCERDPVVEWPMVPGCIAAANMDYLRHLPQASGPLSQALFRERNAKRLPIAGTMGEDVVYIPSAIVKTDTDLSKFRRRYPLGSAVLAFSVPAYVGASAVIFYHHFDAGGSFVRLIRVDGGWSVVRTSGWIE
jgi:hypothetical protein